MYAVIKTGGKQYRVASGEKIKVEQIAADVGQEIVIDQVLAVIDGESHKVGTPLPDRGLAGRPYNRRLPAASASSAIVAFPAARKRPRLCQSTPPTPPPLPPFSA